MRTYSIEIYEKERNRRVICTAESFIIENNILRIYHGTLGNLHVKLSPTEEIRITQDREEAE